MKDDIIMFICVVLWAIILGISEVWNRFKGIKLEDI